MKPTSSYFIFLGLACTIWIAPCQAAETTTNPAGPALGHDLPKPVVRFQTKVGDTTHTTTDTSTIGLGTFPVPPYSTMTYKRMTVSTAVGKVIAFYSPGANPGSDFPDWDVTYQGAYNANHNINWDVTTAFGPNMNTFLATATSKSPTSVTQPADPPTNYVTWELSDPAPPSSSITKTTRTRGSSDFLDIAPQAFFDGHTRRDCQYKAVASRALIGTTVTWVEIFTPEDGSAKQCTVLPPWTIQSNESQVYTLSCPRSGTSTVALLDDSVQISVDADRNGTIDIASESSEVTSPDKPFRFWINDDDDEILDSSARVPFIGQLTPPIYTEIEQDDADVINESQQNWHSDVITCERDLEDFFPLLLSNSGLADALRKGDIKLGFEWSNVLCGSPAFKMFPAADNIAGSSQLFNALAANYQIKWHDGFRFGIAIQDARSDTAPFGEDHSMVQVGETFILPTWVFENLSDKRFLLLEGCSAGTGKLKVVIYDRNNQPIGEGPGIWFDLKSPSEFCHRWSCGDGDSTPPGNVDLNGDNRYGHLPTLADTLPEEERDLILYVHGYNMQEYEKRTWIETTYKRLWHLGYRGHVGGFTWPTAQEFTKFANSEVIAWQAGDQLKQLLIDLRNRGYRVHLLAHSLGNVVACEALRQWREEGNSMTLVDTYIASQAAISAGVYNADSPRMPDYDKSPLTGLARSPMPPDIYGRYWESSDDQLRPSLWASENASYGNKPFMQPAAGIWANFFNRNDYALSGFYETGNRLKPAKLASFITGSLTNQYDYSDAEGFSKEFGTIVPGIPPTWLRLSSESLRFPEDRYEIFSYGAPSWSLALGTIPTGGVFTSFTNLATPPYSFGSEHRWHSGQFRSFNAARYQYWVALLDAALIPHINPNP